MCCMYTVYMYSGMQEWVIQIPSIPILVSVLFPSLHLKYFRIKFLLLVYIILFVEFRPFLVYVLAPIPYKQFILTNPILEVISDTYVPLVCVLV